MAYVGGSQADYAGWNLEAQECCVIHDAIGDMDAHLSAAAPGLDDDESSEEEVDAPM
jgi:hypothetical protein